MSTNPMQGRTKAGRFDSVSRREAADVALDGTPRVDHPEGWARAEALLDENCPSEHVRHAAAHDPNSTVRLQVAMLAPETSIHDPNVAVRALGYVGAGVEPDSDTEVRAFQDWISG